MKKIILGIICLMFALAVSYGNACAQVKPKLKEKHQQIVLKKSACEKLISVEKLEPMPKDPLTQRVLTVCKNKGQKIETIIEITFDKPGGKVTEAKVVRSSTKSALGRYQAQIKISDDMDECLLEECRLVCFFEPPT